MLALWNAKKSSVVGLDIGSSSVRALELGKKDGDFIVENYAHADVPSSAVDGKNIKEPEQIIDVVKKVFKNFKTKKVAVAVPDSSVISKIVQLEGGLTDDEVEELVLLEADKYIPYPIDEVSIDYQFLGSSGRGGSLQDVLIVASRSENVNSKVDLLRECGLDVQIVDVESYATERACQLFKNELLEQNDVKTIAIFDIGDVYTHLTVLHDMHVVFSREEVFGGKQLTNDLVKGYDLGVSEAKQAKKTGELPGDYVEDILEPFQDMVGLQVRRALQFFFSTSQHSEVDLILLSGGSALLPGLVQKIQEVIEVPTKLANPVQNMKVVKGVDDTALRQDSAMLMLACGLAMRKFE